MANLWLIFAGIGALLLLLALRLKPGRQRIIVMSSVVAGICLAYMLYLFVAGKNGTTPGDATLAKAKTQCRLDNRLENGFHLCFTGFDRADFSDSVLIRRTNTSGTLIGEDRQRLSVFTDGGFQVCCRYVSPIALDDVLEISSGKQKYTIKGFVVQPFVGMTATGTASVSGCVLDSAVVNGKKIKFSQQMEIRKSDSL